MVSLFIAEIPFAIGLIVHVEKIDNEMRIEIYNCLFPNKTDNPMIAHNKIKPM